MSRFPPLLWTLTTSILSRSSRRASSPPTTSSPTPISSTTSKTTSTMLISTNPTFIISLCPLKGSIGTATEVSMRLGCLRLFGAFSFIVLILFHEGSGFSRSLQGCSSLHSYSICHKAD